MANQGAKRQVENNRSCSCYSKSYLRSRCVHWGLNLAPCLPSSPNQPHLPDCLIYRRSNKGVYVTPPGYICASAPRLLLQVICYSALRAANPCQYSPLCLLQLHQGAGRQVLTCGCFAHQQLHMPANLRVIWKDQTQKHTCPLLQSLPMRMGSFSMGAQTLTSRAACLIMQ